MKKWYIAMILAILPMLAISFASCNDDDTIPNVDISLDLSKGVVADGVIYVVQGDTIDVAAVKVVNNEANKGAAVTNVNYYWDGYYYAPAVFTPYAMTFPTSENTALGNHEIGLTCTVLAVDKSIASATISFPVKVVASADQIPSNPATQVISTTSLSN